jgi:phytoene synthase
MIQKTMTYHPTPTDQIYGSIAPVEVLRRCGATFYAASRVLPPAVRNDLAILYAMCRAIDDCADVADPLVADALLDEVSAALRAEHDRSPLVASFRDLTIRHDIPPVLVHELIQGVRSDLREVRMVTIDELLRYSFRVASTVGLMMCRVLNVPRCGDPFAIDLGIAMQLTNIARDVAEDARLDRVYLPAEWVNAEAVLSGANNPTNGAPEVRGAVEELLAFADRYYESAELGMQYLPLAVRGGIRAAAWNYRAIGSGIRRNPAAPLCHRVRTSRRGKIARTVAAVWASSLESLPLGPSDTHDESLHGALRALRLATA